MQLRAITRLSRTPSYSISQRAYSAASRGVAEVHFDIIFSNINSILIYFLTTTQPNDKMKKKINRMPDSNTNNADMKNDPEADVHEAFPGGFQDNM